jgi:hypothetical protein
MLDVKKKDFAGLEFDFKDYSVALRNTHILYKFDTKKGYFTYPVFGFKIEYTEDYDSAHADALRMVKIEESDFLDNKIIYFTYEANPSRHIFDAIARSRRLTHILDIDKKNYLKYLKSKKQS